MTDAITAQKIEQSVRDFLAAIERRDLATCSALAAPGLQMTFPGGLEHASFEALFASSSGRYQRVGKHIEQVDVMRAGDLWIAYCFGTLHGVWRDETPFEGIRFIDRFELRDGLIMRQQVWNDSAHRQMALAAQQFR